MVFLIVRATALLMPSGITSVLTEVFGELVVDTSFVVGTNSELKRKCLLLWVIHVRTDGIGPRFICNVLLNMEPFKKMNYLISI